MLFGLLKKTRRPSRSPYRPSLEALEDRSLLSSGWAVNNLGSGTFTALPALSPPDAAGDLYVTGYFTGTATFGATTLSASTQSTYVAKVDPNGNFLWADLLGGSASGAPDGIALDGGGNVYVTGNFGGTAAFGGTTLTSAGQVDVYSPSWIPTATSSGHGRRGEPSMIGAREWRWTAAATST
jgi:hypothetical protein